MAKMKFFLALAAAASLIGCSEPDAGSLLQHEPIVGLPCEGCEAVFEGMPTSLSWRARIAPVDEPGEPLMLKGTVRDAQGQVAAGVVVYAYHTNAQGLYPANDAIRGTASVRHGRLRGWTKTDEQGRYQFDTIRPASYPGANPPPQHIHMNLLEPGRCTYYVDEVQFDDDPLLGAEARALTAHGRGGSGLVHPTRAADGAWQATRDLVLGLGVPGYPNTSD